MQQSTSLASLESKNKIIESKYTIHPFSTLVNSNNIESVFANYLAMSQAFPYLQAGSQKDLIFHYMQLNQDIPMNVEVNSVIANFLTWDETGGFHAVIEKKQEGLLDILNTKANFHSNMLKSDIKVLTGKDMVPDYSKITSQYLIALYGGLSNIDPIKRVACMIAFESHAEKMITSLWNSVVSIYDAERDSLVYFYVHVGGDDPAEQYHVKMTNQMIDKTVPIESIESFLEAFDYYYAINFNWCRDISVNMN